jgi:hypothetical protein
MTEPNKATDSTRVAIECLTLRMESGDDARQRAAENIAALQYALEGPGATPVPRCGERSYCTRHEPCYLPVDTRPDHSESVLGRRTEAEFVVTREHPLIDCAYDMVYHVLKLRHVVPSC